MDLTVESQFKDGTSGGVISYNEEQLIQLTEPRERVPMVPANRPAVKLTEPGSNKDDIINPNGNLKRARLIQSRRDK